MNFKAALNDQLSNKTLAKSTFGKGLTKVAGHPLALKRMENVARAHFGLSKTEAFDWGDVDWAALLAFLKEILPLIMALFGLG